MNKRTFTILAVVTLAIVVIAIFAKSGGDTDAASHASTAKFFPDLVVNDVVKMTVAGPDTASSMDSTAESTDPATPKKVTNFVIKKEGDSWGAADKGGYGVDVGKVKQLVLGLADMNIVGEMTKKPESYKKLSVEDITEPEAASKRVTLEDKNGKVVADVLIGKPHTTKNFGGKPALYVRRVGDAQAYEVSGQINLDVTASNWLDREISKIESARVRKVTTTKNDGTQLVVAKTAPEEQNFTVEGLPEGKELMWPGVANGIAGALQYLSLDDVQKNENFDMSGATITEFVTFDGMVVTVETLEKDGKNWLTLSAAFDESQIKDVATVEPPPPAEGEKKEGETTPPAAEPKKPARKSPDEVKKEVEELNKRAGPWVYSIQGYTAANFRKSMEDLLKKPEPAVAPKEDGLKEDGSAPIEDLTGGKADELGLDDGTHVHDDGTVHDSSHQPVTPPVEPPKDPEKKPDQPPGGGR